MRKNIEIVTCDICGKKDNEIQLENLQIIFTTEQTEGRSCEPYLIKEQLEICPECLGKIVNGKSILYGSGAQGYNKFWLKNVKE